MATMRAWKIAKDRPVLRFHMFDSGSSSGETSGDQSGSYHSQSSGRDR